MGDTIEAKGVIFRTEGLSPDSLKYLNGKLRRIRRKEKQNRNPFTRLFHALLPADYRRVEVETRVEGKILVVGCNAGLETLKLGAVGIDLNFPALRIAKDLSVHAESATAGFIAASGAELPFPDASFNCLLSDNVVEHFPGALLPPHFREAFRVLRPGGWYVFTTPNRLFEYPPKGEPISLHTYGEWEAMVLDAGFRNLQTPHRLSGDLGGLTWKKQYEHKAATRSLRWGISNRGVRMVTIVAYR